MKGELRFSPISDPYRSLLDVVRLFLPSIVRMCIRVVHSRPADFQLLVESLTKSSGRLLVAGHHRKKLAKRLIARTQLDSPVVKQTRTKAQLRQFWDVDLKAPD